MIAGLLLGFVKKKAPPIDVSGHADEATLAIWVGLGLIAVFFAVRPELWRRLFFERVDPRPAALLRIALGATVLWTFVDYLVLTGEFLFTEEGLWLTELARKNYGGKLKKLWDPEHGFEHWYDIFLALTGRFSLLHFRSDKLFAYAIFGLLFLSSASMILGFWSRTSTIVTWFLSDTLYNYSPISYTGGDTVIRVAIFMAIFVNAGQAYSIDSWRRRRKAIMGGSEGVPALHRIAPWPLRLMMLQLACIYCATGVLKSGRTWMDGTALYYALNLDHFYRFPPQRLVVILDYLYLTRIATVVVHWWEILFPIALIGQALQGWEGDRARGTWPFAAPWRRIASWGIFAAFWALVCYVAGLGAFYYYIPPPDISVPASKAIAREITWWVTPFLPVLFVGAYLGMRRRFPDGHAFVLRWILGKRTWLGIGFLMHLGIDLGLNVGTFVQIMVATYFAWWTGADVDKMWSLIFRRAAHPGEAGRPALPRGRAARFAVRLRAPLERLRYRVARAPWVVLHDEDEDSVRRAALLRCWDVAGRLEFKLQPRVGAGLHLLVPDAKRVHGSTAAQRLLRIFPALWPLWLLYPLAGPLVLRVLHQRR